jgi:hypothetical protein
LKTELVAIPRLFEIVDEMGMLRAQLFEERPDFLFRLRSGAVVRKADFHGEFSRGSR